MIDGEVVLSRLGQVIGLTALLTQRGLASVRDITIAWEIAQTVRRDVMIPKPYALTPKTFPGFDDLRPKAQGA